MSQQSGGGRVPPHSDEAERAVLGAILLNGDDVIHRVLEHHLESRDFYHKAHQKIFEAMRALAEEGSVSDLTSVSTRLRDRGDLEAIGGVGHLSGYLADTFAVGNVAYYSKIVKEKAILRRTIEAAGEIIAQGYDGVENLDDFLDEAERKIFSLSDQKSGKSLTALASIIYTNMGSMQELAKKGSDVIGLSTGFTKLDTLTSGFRGGQLIILAARPAMGKTSLFLSAVQNIVQTGEAVVAIFSLEMSSEELGFRFLSGMTHIESKKLKVGNLSTADWKELGEAASRLHKSRVFIDDSADITVMDIRARCRRLVASEKRLDLIVVDYLQLMRGSSKASRGDSSREREISEISRGLKALAKELRVPIIALSQHNRGVESRPNKRPMLSDLRESGAIEQDADMVCFIYRDEVYNKDTADKGVAELIVAKHRAGETDTIRLAWLAQYTLFANLAEEDRYATQLSPPRLDRGDYLE